MVAASDSLDVSGRISGIVTDPSDSESAAKLVPTGIVTFFDGPTANEYGGLTAVDQGAIEADGNSTALASVTDLVIDPFNRN